MKPTTAEWVAKAEGDFLSAQREIAADPSPNFDAAAFHAQQCAEKYLKARLVEAGATFPKTHDLESILQLVLPFEPFWNSLRVELNALTDMAVEVRYPGAFATAQDACCAIDTARKVRAAARDSMGLPP